MNKIMIIMQGPPGGGKSTAAKTLAPFYNNAVICSTDDFFYKSSKSGEYEYVPSRIGEAHEWNRKRVKWFISLERNVIVDNTNIRAWEARPYVEMAVEAGYDVRFARYDGKYPNVHGVPEEVVQRMRANMEVLSVSACLKAEKPAFQKKA